MSLGGNAGASGVAKCIMDFIKAKKKEVTKNIQNKKVKEYVIKYLNEVYNEAKSIKKTADNGWW